MGRSAMGPALLGLALVGCGSSSSEGHASIGESPSEEIVGAETSPGDSESPARPGGCSADPEDPTVSVAPCPESLERAMTFEGIRRHLRAFQTIADANHGTRVAGGPGFEASVQYVFDRLSESGYRPALQAFSIDGFVEATPTVFEELAPSPRVYVRGSDFYVSEGAGDGDVAAATSAVDLRLGLGNRSTSGCESSDFGGFPPGNIALIQRGGCPFAEKVANAEAAGAVGIVLFNQGETNTRDRRGLLWVTAEGASVPVVFVDYATGVGFGETIDTSGLSLRIAVDAEREFTVHNVIAETRGDDSDGVTMFGAHLDSIGAGPGIQDNGSGAAMILEAALQIAGCTPGKRLRFAWWAAEEAGLLGSFHYVQDLSPTERDGIARYLNFDAVASPNFVRRVLSGSTAPAGSSEIERVFDEYFTAAGLETARFDPAEGSDYTAFERAGIAVGALHTGTNGIKSAVEAMMYGGTAGEPYDRCYHLACDDLDNISEEALMQNAGATAHAIETYWRD